MKKIFLTISFVYFMALASHAQGISGGIKAGLNLTNQNISFGSLSLNTNSKVGFHGGAYLTAMFSEKIGLQPEILFSMQGSEVDLFGDKGKFNFNYVNVPVLVRFNITDMVNIHAGPQLGLLLSAEAKGDDGSSEDIKDSMKGTDISAAFGLGIDLPMGLNFGLRYNLGLVDVAEDDDGDVELKNSNFQIYVGFRLFGK